MEYFASRLDRKAILCKGLLFWERERSEVSAPAIVCLKVFLKKVRHGGLDTLKCLRRPSIMGNGIFLRYRDCRYLCNTF